MKLFRIFFALLWCSVSAQHTLPLDAARLADVQDFLVDDYGDIYVYRSRNFSVTKYDSLGAERGRLMLTLPFRMQNVQNPLRVPLFSRNAQQLKLYDQNLNETETVKFSPQLGFITGAFPEDQQQLWLLDSGARRLIKYNFRDATVLNIYPIDTDYEGVVDFIMYDAKIYMLSSAEFNVFKLNGERIFSAKINEGKRLRREGETIFIISKNEISKLGEAGITSVFKGDENSIVDKNPGGYFELKGAKLYLYTAEQ